METWDLPAFKKYGSEFMCDYVRSMNDYDYFDVVAFDGGEEIELPQQGVVTVATIAPPWDESTEYILPPW